MNLFAEAIAWLTSPEQYEGAGSLPARIGEHLFFTFVAVLTLALGIGANAAIFSVVHGLLLRPLPYHEGDRLVTVNHLYPSLKGLEANVSAVGFGDIRDNVKSFDGVAVEGRWQPTLTGQGDPERLTGARASGDYFSTLGVRPALGRVFDAPPARGAKARPPASSAGNS